MPDGKVGTKERVEAAWRRFYDWKTEHQFLGRYSVDKLQQFDHYQANTGLARCLAIILLISVLPVFLLLVGLHAIPVASPDLGLQHNIGAAVRSAIGHAVLTVSWVYFMMHSLGTTKDSHPVKIVTLSVLAGGVIPEGLSAAVSLLWRYPVPGIGVVKVVISLVCIVLVTRFSQTKESRVMNRQRSRILTIVTAQYLLIVVFYMLLALGFSKAPWGIQLSLMAVQVPLRSFLKRQSWVYARKLSDLSSDVTLNIVDISASMYQALCVLYAHNAKLAALIVIGEFALGIAVARMYSTHTFIVDGYRTLQTAIKIVEGSLTSTLVVEEEEEEKDEAPKEELARLDEVQPSQEKTAEAMASTEVQAIEIPEAAHRLRRSSSDTATHSRGSTRQLSGLTEGTTTSGNELQSSKCFPTVVRKVRRVLSDPVTNKLRAIRRHSNGADEASIAEGSQVVRASTKTGQKSPSSKTSQQENTPKQDRLHRRMSEVAGVDSARTDPPLTAKNVQLLRRTASDTIPENKSQELPTRKSGFRDATWERRPSTRRTNDPRLQSWARDPAKVYCFTDIRPESASSPPSPKQKRPPNQRRSSIDLPPLANLQSTDFGSRPPLRRSASVFLTPRTLMKHGSKRLLDLGRSTGRGAGNSFPRAGDAAQKTSPSDARRATQVSIDGMLVVRKDQARILEQTLQLLFSCEVVVVAEFVKVLVPFVLGLLLITLWHLPSGSYNIILRGLSKGEVVEKMLWCFGFAAFEVPALAMTCTVVFKKYGISPLHLLAFLLEQQYANFQTKLTSCFIALIFLTSVHQGMDWISK